MSNLKITLVCSLPDQASVNIANNLLKLANWEKRSPPSNEQISAALKKYPIIDEKERSNFDRQNESDEFEIVYPYENETSSITEVYEYGPFRLVYINGRHIFQDRLDKRLEFLGLPASRLIFVSKHSSKSEIESFTVHTTGNPGDAILGGFPNELAVSDPGFLGFVLKHLEIKNEEYNLGFDVTLEVTHHGPTEIEIPSMFVEIGSTEKEWTNETAGKTIAESVFAIIDFYDENTKNLKNSEFYNESTPIAVGFGGGHYAQRQTKHLLSEKLLFGHIFPKYAIGNVDEDLLLKAFEKSFAKYAYFDKKSISGSDRRRLTEILDRNEIEILTDTDLK